MDAVTLAIAALAVYRLARMVTLEPGPYLWRTEPYGVFARLRAVLTTGLDERGEPTNFLGALLSCPLCLSVWIGAAVALLLWLWPPSWWLLLPFALSGAATLALSREE